MVQADPILDRVSEDQTGDAKWNTVADIIGAEVIRQFVVHLRRSDLLPYPLGYATRQTAPVLDQPVQVERLTKRSVLANGARSSTSPQGIVTLRWRIHSR